MALVKLPKENDWVGLRQALHRLATLRLGTEASPSWLAITVESVANLAIISADSLSLTSNFTADSASFVSVFATRATITTLAVSSASISALTATSVFATRATLSTAVIKRLLVGGIVS